MNEQTEDDAQDCERCNRTTSHMIRSVSPDNREIILCWSCVQRHEKRINVTNSFRRPSRFACRGVHSS